MPMLTPDFLANIPIFRGTTEQERGQLLQVMVREHFDAGAEVVRSGEVSRGLHVIVEGTATVVLDVHGFVNPIIGDEDSSTVDHERLTTLELGSAFGEVSFFHGGAHSATIQAIADLDLLTLTIDEYEQLLKRDNLVAYKIGLNAAHILADRLRGADRTIADLVLAQYEPIARSRWFASHEAFFTDETAPRFFH